LKRYLELSHLGVDAISSADLYFLTQKEGAKFRAKSCVPVSIQRRTQDESGLLSQLAQWVLFNLHGDEEELLTLRWKGVNKKLLRREMTAYIKKIASLMDLNPQRFGNHSLRRGYATAAHQQCIEDMVKGCNERAGWAPKSTMVISHYSHVNNHGALAFSGNSINTSRGVPMADVLGTNGTTKGVKSPLK
jgi:hypothetical protein